MWCPFIFRWKENRERSRLFPEIDMLFKRVISQEIYASESKRSTSIITLLSRFIRFDTSENPLSPLEKVSELVEKGKEDGEEP